MTADLRSVLFHVGQQLKADAHLLSDDSEIQKRAINIAVGYAG